MNYEPCEICRGPLPYGGHVATPVCDACLDGGVIILEYGAREVLAGYRLYMWQPFYRRNGRYIDLSQARALDAREDALRVSESAAREDAAHYVGDWSITVREATC